MAVSRKLFEGDSAEVARDLLGHELVHEFERRRMAGKIVETEAYFGVEDPASRACDKRTKVNELMWDEPGTSLVYMVHANWLFNVVSESEGKPGAVLIRALEPVEGVEAMRERRGMDRLMDLTSGPGKLTEAIGITKDQHGVDLTRSDSLYIRRSDDPEDLEIEKSKRIGVSEDLDRDLRFYLCDNEHVSC